MLILSSSLPSPLSPLLLRPQCHEYHELAAPSGTMNTTATATATAGNLTVSRDNNGTGSASSNSSGGGTVNANKINGINGNNLIRNEKGEPQLVTRLL